MPSRDPQTGRRLSGAAQRKLKTAPAAGRAAPPPKPATGRLGRLLKKLGPPPSDPTEMILWANQITGALAWAVLVEPGAVTPQQFQQAKELLATVGKLYPRAEVEKLLKQILEQRGGAADPAAGLAPVQPGGWQKALPAPPAPEPEQDPGEAGDRSAAPPDRGGGEPAPG